GEVHRDGQGAPGFAPTGVDLRVLDVELDERAGENSGGRGFLCVSITTRHQEQDQNGSKRSEESLDHRRFSSPRDTIWSKVREGHEAVWRVALLSAGRSACQFPLADDGVTTREEGTHAGFLPAAGGGRPEDVLLHASRDRESGGWSELHAQRRRDAGARGGIGVG